MLTGILVNKKEKHDPKLVALAGEWSKHMKMESDISNLSQVFRRLFYCYKRLIDMNIPNQTGHRREADLRSRVLSVAHKIPI